MAPEPSAHEDKKGLFAQADTGTILRAVIRHCGGNLRRITGYWDCASERTVRSLIRKRGLWEEVLRARESGRGV